MKCIYSALNYLVPATQGAATQTLPPGACAEIAVNTLHSRVLVVQDQPLSYAGDRVGWEL